MTVSNSAVPASIEALVQLFQTDLLDVAFPDVDCDSLVKDHATVLELNAALESARAELERAQEVLRVNAMRAHAYAAVYAGEDGELAEKLSAIPLKTKRRRAERKSERKPRKQRTQVKAATLPFEGEVEDQIEAAE